MSFILMLLGLAIVGFIQNMAFTAVSRSRNGGDIWYHFKTAILSNSIWFVCNFFILFGTMLRAITQGDTVQAITVLLVYSIATSLGSVFMMALKLGKISFHPKLKWLEAMVVETGNRKVGSR